MRLMIVPLLAAGVAFVGCAKKSYVQREVGEVNQKVDAVSAEVEKTQERVRQNEVQIAKVEKDSQAGIADAKSSADAAMTKAAEAEEAAKGKLVYTLTLSNDKVQFPFAKSELSDEAKAMIDDTIGPLVQKNAGVWFEVEGHTDDVPISTSRFPSNWELSAARAGSAVRYLSRGGVPASRLRAIGFADTRPLVPNTNTENRGKNRRIEFLFVRPDDERPGATDGDRIHFTAPLVAE